MKEKNSYFLDSGSYIMDGIIGLNDHIIYYEIILTIIVIWILIYNINPKKFTIKDIIKGEKIEIIWTIIPAIILIIIALPSFRLLYLMEDMIESNITIKVIGHQWYWSYEYKDEEFTSYIKRDIEKGGIRLLDVDEYLILPSNVLIRFLITSTDVIHSWGIPSLGIKLDAVPGRINQFGIEIYRPGLYYGQCYELCGIGHPYMPILLQIL